MQFKNKLNRNSFLSSLTSLAVHLVIIGLLFIFRKNIIPEFHEAKYSPVPVITTFEVSTTAFSVMKSQNILTYGQSRAGDLNAAQNSLTIEPPMESLHLDGYDPPSLPDDKHKPIPNPVSTPQSIPQYSGTVSSSSTAGNSDGIAYNAAELSAIPKQTVEVVPELTGRSVKGTISLTLRIGLDGRVKEYRILKNTINNPDCLQKVIEAAQKSKWEKVTFKGNQVEYWIDKSYIFN